MVVVVVVVNKYLILESLVFKVVVLVVEKMLFCLVCYNSTLFAKRLNKSLNVV